jgi:hypothetical protein
MKPFLPLFAAAAMTATMSAPAFAASHGVDAMTVTCADFTAMDMDGMMAVTDAVDMAMMTADMTEDEKMAAMAEHDAMMASEMTEDQKTEMMMKSEESMKAMMEACGKDGMSGMTVMDAMHGNM